MPKQKIKQNFCCRRNIIFKTIFNLIKNTCNLFYKLNLKQNDRITLFLENSVEFVILYCFNGMVSS